MTRPPLIISLADAGSQPAAMVGRKARNLGRLIAAGLPVPPGFCLTAAAFELHLAGCGTLPADPAGVREAIARAAIPGPVREALAGAWAELARQADRPLIAAVRSSAAAEDGGERSFAGQHATVLGVVALEACLDAVKACWRSYWSDRAAAYRAHGGTDAGPGGMAVIVQVLVPATAAGVMFTVDPVTGDKGRIVIEACAGLGEQLVSGRISPRRLVLDRTALAVREDIPGTQTERWAARPDGGTAVEPVLAVHWMDADLARRIAALGLRAEKIWGAPQDIEWAVLGDGIFLLQARPVTATGTAPADNEDRLVWTNANTGEVLPDVATPMTWSVAEPVVDRLIGRFLRLVGIDTNGLPIIRLIAGRAYFCLSTLAGLLRRVPGMRNRSLTDIFGGRQEDLANIVWRSEDLPAVRFSYLRFALHVPLLALRALLFTPARGERLMDGIRAATRRLAAVRPEDLDDRELAAYIHQIGRDLLDNARVIDAAGIAAGFGQVLYDRLGTWFGRSDGTAFTSRLMAGLGTNDNANAGLALWALARAACADAAAAAAVREAHDPAGLREHLGTSVAGRTFLEQWDGFMAEHGHHCRGEIEFINPRWAETPGYILDMVRSYLDSDSDLPARYARLAIDREAARAEVRRRLRNPFKRLEFRFLAGRAQGAAVMRENVKSEMVRRLFLARKAMLELGSRKVRAGVLAQPDDIFFIMAGELAPLAAGALADVRTTIAARRAEYERNRRLSPPPVVIGRFDPDHPAPLRPPAAGDVLTGVPVNPGLVRGRARVILREGTDFVRPGEVLVAPFTDPGWTPYFMNAAAIVTDLGGLLSHGSIVARELGIPAVVNVGPGTVRIHTGDLVEVDGTRGTVRIIRC
ncbi:MAG: PEP/pyruvate-binding domain-containing protein [Planctomycetota bacterium]